MRAKTSHESLAVIAPGDALIGSMSEQVNQQPDESTVPTLEHDAETTAAAHDPFVVEEDELPTGEPTLGPAHRRRRTTKVDDILAEAKDIALTGVEAVAPHNSIGLVHHLRGEEERLTTHLFECLLPGYRGWFWFATLSRAPRSKVATICEVGLIPGDDALLAPEWVPWEERLRPSDISRDDVLPYKAEDERLEQGFEDTSDDPDLPIVRELGLGRARVLSQEGRDQAAKRWYDSERGPKSGRRPRNTCSSCGFLMKMSGDMRTMFGVCANEWATDDGAVVSLDHTCGSHSETDVPKNGTAWPVRPSRINEGALDAEPMPRASDELKADEAGASAASEQAD